MNAATETAFVDTFGGGEDEVAPIANGLLDDLADLGLSPAAVQAMMVVASRGLHEVFAYCFQGRPIDERGLRTGMRRFVAVAWMLHSEMLVGKDGQPLTLEQIGALPQIDCTRCTLSVLAQNFGKQWDFHSRVQKRMGGKPNYAASAKTGWEKRRLPMKECQQCHANKSRDQFRKNDVFCIPCHDARRAEKSEREVAKASRPAKQPPHCAVCDTHDLHRLIARRLPSGGVGFRSLCYDCHNERKRLKKSAEAPPDASTLTEEHSG